MKLKKDEFRCMVCNKIEKEKKGFWKALSRHEAILVCGKCATLTKKQMKGYFEK
jgi:hypothetical protein